MIERVIFDVLEAAIAKVAADPTLLDKVFQPEGAPWRISDAELAKIKAWFVDPRSGRPILRHGYATPGVQLPCWCLVNRAESLEKQLLGNFATNDCNDAGVSVTGAIERRTYEVLSYAHTPDQAYYLHKILKACVLWNLALLESRGAMAMTWSGRELQPVPNLGADWSFVRALTLSTMVEEYVSDAAVTVINGIDVRFVEAGGAVSPYIAWRDESLEI